MGATSKFIKVRSTDFIIKTNKMSGCHSTLQPIS